MAWRVETTEQETLETVRLALGDEYLDSLAERDVRGFLSQVRKHFYKRGEAIFHEDDTPGDVYIVAKGHVKHRLVSSDGVEFTHKLSPPGDFFGSFGSPRRYGATQALTDCELLVVDRDEFLAFLGLTGDANAFLVRTQSRKAELLIKRIYDLVFLNVQMRLASVLIDVAEPTCNGDSVELIVPDYLNQNELSQLVGATRESINQWLKFFEKQGWIAIRGRQTVILDKDALRHILR